MTENQIVEEVKRYINDKSYNYAILINGEWGTGKSYFYKNTLEMAIKNEIKDKSYGGVHYFSLYGCNDVQEIYESVLLTFLLSEVDNRVFSPRRKKLPEYLQGDITRKLASFIINKYNINELVESVTKTSLKKSTVFVFDDLERCNCDINEVFGLVNDLVEHKDIKVIIIANEKEISYASESSSMSEMQYLIALNDKIEWPKEDSIFERGNNTSAVTIDELNRRKKTLFSDTKNKEIYNNIREKIIGVTLQYEPDINETIKGIITKNSDDSVRNFLLCYVPSIISVMNEYNHYNLRTFQFFISKLNYLISKLDTTIIDKDYSEKVYETIAIQTLRCCMDYRSNKQFNTEIDQLFREQNTKSKAIKDYVEKGLFDDRRYQEEIKTILTEIKNSIYNDDPYYLLSEKYYLEEQKWVEEKLNKMLEKLKENKYSFNIYNKMIIIVARLCSIGFDDQYLDSVKSIMIENLKNSDNTIEISKDLYFVEEGSFKNSVSNLIEEINETIRERRNELEKKSIKDIVQKVNWADELLKYVTYKDHVYTLTIDKPIFSKLPAKDWSELIHKSSPYECNQLRIVLRNMYLGGTNKKSLKEDYPVLCELYGLLESYEDVDLIKRLNAGWLKEDLKEIIEKEDNKS